MMINFFQDICIHIKDILYCPAKESYHNFQTVYMWQCIFPHPQGHAGMFLLCLKLFQIDSFLKGEQIRARDKTLESAATLANKEESGGN